MNAALYWFGVFHAVLYASVGAVVGGLWLIVECWGRILNRRRMLTAIINWHLAVRRWERRREHGLSDREWKRGEPKPAHFLPASADTHPKGGDVQQAPLVSGAVPEGETPDA
jgi:hypothetical protein